VFTYHALKLTRLYPSRQSLGWLSIEDRKPNITTTAIHHKHDPGGLGTITARAHRANKVSKQLGLD